MRRSDKVRFLLLASLGLTGQVLFAADSNGDAKWLADANGCKFLNPGGTSPATIVEWDGACVNGFISGPGQVRVSPVLVYRGEFSEGHAVKGVVESDGITFEGGFADNAPHGEVIASLRDGSTIKGTFDHGKIAAGNAEITWANGTKYRGEIDPRSRAMHGRGILEYSEGSVYEGEFKQGRVEGVGVMKRANGEVRRGTFLGGRLHGKGSVLYPNQSRYEGELLADEPSGQGRMEFANGVSYEGAFVSGQYQGKGKLIYADGTSVEGDFVAGEPHGTVTRHYEDGTHYAGQFLYGKPHGTGALSRPSGRVEEGEWKNGLLTGKCRIVEGESVYEGGCLNALFDGKGSLHAGGVTMRGDFELGVLVRGTIAAADGRTYEIDVEKDEVLEVLKDGTKRPVGELPADITI